MDWIKISTDSLLLSEHTNRQLLVLIKYQALYCQLEREPSIPHLKRYFTRNDIEFISKYKQSVNELCQKEIKKITQKRGRNKTYYEVNKPNSDKIQTSESKHSVRADKIREDKIREDKIREEEKSIKKESTFNKAKPKDAKEVTEYAKSIAFTLDGEYFIDFYQSKNWKIGKNPMKDWKACVRTWKKNNDTPNKQQTFGLKGGLKGNEKFKKSL